MKNRRRTTTTRLTGDAAARGEASVRPLARSVVLYAVLGTLALHAPPAPLALAQDGETARAEARRRVGVDSRPLRELLSKVRRMRERGELNLDGPASLAVEGDLNEDGTLSNQTFSFAGDESLRGLAGEIAQSLQESRAYSLLHGARRVRLTLALDGQSFNARADADADTAERAERMSQGYGVLLNLARLSKKGRPEAVVFNNLTVSANGKRLSLNLDLTREALGNLLLKQVTPN